MAGEEPAEPGHEPAARERRDRGDRDDGPARRATQPAVGGVEPREDVAQRRRPGPAVRGQRQPAGLADEQLGRQVILELPDLVADGGLGDAQLMSCARHARVAGSGLEGA